MSSELDILRSFNINPKIRRLESDPQTRRYFAQIFTGMGGRFTRLKIISLLSKTPMNAHQVAKKLSYDYKTIQYNIKILEKHGLVKRITQKHGAVFYVTHFLQENIPSLEDVINKVGRKINTKKKYIT